MKLWVVTLLFAGAFAFSCKDQSGNDVDWWAVYKMPIESGQNTIPGIGQGLGYYYVDVKKQGNFEPSTKQLNETGHAISYTLQQFYDVQSDPSVFHVMYNDEPYNTTCTEDDCDKQTNIFKEYLRANRIHPGIAAKVEYGHTKGVVFFNGQTGIWLVHSVPKFPPPKHYAYPDSGTNYGQSMLCMTFNYSELKKIGTQLYFNHPDIYSSNLPTQMAADNPDLARVIGGEYKTGEPYSSVMDLNTIGGYSFKSFAKTYAFNDDLYDGLVAQVLKTDLLAETWRRGKEVPLECKLTYYTLDVQNVKVGTTLAFKYTKDHSKTARSTDTTKPFVCIGDINRMTSQYSRGGGTECISSSFLWKAYNVFVDSNTCT